MNLSMNDWEANRAALQARDRMIASLKQELFDTQAKLAKAEGRLEVIESFLFDIDGSKKST